MWNERQEITVIELKMRNLSLRIKCSFSKINSAFFYHRLVKVALKNFKRMLLVHCFDGFFRFLNRFLIAFLLNWLKNLRVQFGLYRKKAGVRIPWTPSSPLDARVKSAIKKRYAKISSIKSCYISLVLF